MWTHLAFIALKNWTAKLKPNQVKETFCSVGNVWCTCDKSCTHLWDIDKTVGVKCGGYIVCVTPRKCHPNTKCFRRMCFRKYRTRRFIRWIRMVNSMCVVLELITHNFGYAHRDQHRRIGNIAKRSKCWLVSNLCIYLSKIASRLIS